MFSTNYIFKESITSTLNRKVFKIDDNDKDYCYLLSNLFIIMSDGWMMNAHYFTIMYQNNCGPIEIRLPIQTSIILSFLPNATLSTTITHYK